MLASRLHDATDTDAELPNDPAYLSALTGCKFTHKTMKSLIDKGFYEPCKHDASTTLAKCYPETETYTKEKETTLSGKPDDAREVLNFLNEKTGLHFRDVPTNMKLIQARLKEGATVQDCRAVIAIQRRQWKDDDKMRDYLRPATLFNATKFWQYHGKVGQANEVPRVQNANDARRATESVIEGIATCESTIALAKRFNVEMPITEAVYAVIFEGKAVDSAISDLMTRKLRAE